jgi:SagB-type dehydrogenase family enzyme
LSPHVSLEAHASGEIFASFDGYLVGLGTFSAETAERAQSLRSGLPLASLEKSRAVLDSEIQLLVRRLAVRGLLEYPLQRSEQDGDQLVIEPQIADYWPATPPLADTDILVLSRFAYMRRRGNELVLESPRAGALLRICNPQIAAAVATLSVPQQLRKLRRQDGFPGVAILALLVDCRILFKVDSAGDPGLRTTEGDHSLVLWDFHDLLFHARSTEGRHANPVGGMFPYVGVMPPLPAARAPWPGKKIDLRGSSAPGSESTSPLAKLLQARHSTRDFDDQKPITFAELSAFLGTTAHILSRWSSEAPVGDPAVLVEYATRPYPSAGASYPLELYLAVGKCEGLARGFYHYDAGEDALVSIDTRTQDLQVLLTAAKLAMDAAETPQVLITIAARFGRISWKYSSIAYGLILKDVGVLLQTFYLTATEMGLGGCAIGTTNINLFARMTGIDFHIEGAVGQFALGRAGQSSASE